MKKRTWLLAMLLVASLAFAGCTSQQKPAGEEGQKEQQEEQKPEQGQPQEPDLGEDDKQPVVQPQPEEGEQAPGEQGEQQKPETEKKPDKPDSSQGGQKPQAPAKPNGGGSGQNPGTGDNNTGNQPDPAPQPTPEPEPTPEPDPEPQPTKSATEVVDTLLTKADMAAGNVADLGDLVSAFYPTIDLSKIESYCVKGPMMNVKAGEVAVFQVKDSADAPAVEQALKQRAADVAKTFEHYLQDQYEIAQKAVVRTKGSYVVLIIDGNSAALAQLFDTLV